MTLQLIAEPARTAGYLTTRLDQHRAPILEALRAYRASGTVPFTTPGHKLGRGADPELADLLGRDLFANDIWLNTGHFGEILRDAEDLAADAWGAERTHFLVNGSSSGNVAALLALVRPGDEVIVGRDMHRSMLAALILSGARPIYVVPRVHPALGVSLGLAPEDAAATLDAHPNARLVALVSPSYYGIATDVPAIVREAHGRDVPVYVDEAWGPHFGFHPLLPVSAMQAGADMAVISAHKLLGCLSQGSMLHVQGTRVDSRRLASTVAMTQTTSPLLPILVSLDTSRRQMALAGAALIERTVSLANQARRRLNALPGISVIDTRMRGGWTTDVTRLVIDVTGAGLSGYAAEQLLRANGVAPEMSDLHSIVCLITIGDDHASIDRLVAGIAEVSRVAQGRPRLNRSEGRALGPVVCSGQAALSPTDAFHAPARSAAVGEAIGQICAEMIVPYPPGIPVFLPGEVVTTEKVAYLTDGRARGMTLSGACDPTLETIRVVA